MATIGTLTRRQDGAFIGSLTIKSYGGRAFLQPIARTGPNAPDYRLYGVGVGGHPFEAGAAWRKTRQDGSGDYVSVKIDFPELQEPIYATLGVMAGQDDPDVFAIIWNRPAASGAAADPFAALTTGQGERDGADSATDAFDGGPAAIADPGHAPHDPDPFGGLEREEVPEPGAPHDDEAAPARRRRGAE